MEALLSSSCQRLRAMFPALTTFRHARAARRAPGTRLRGSARGSRLAACFRMNLKRRAIQRVRVLLTVVSAVALVPGDTFALALSSLQVDATAQTESPDADVPGIPSDQLDSLVAPIALYPDPLLAQTLAASTYPLELIQLQQWLLKNAGLKDNALADAVAKQPWDPSIQAMAGLPDVVKRLADDIQWTTDLGNAFLAQ